MLNDLVCKDAAISPQNLEPQGLAGKIFKTWDLADTTFAASFPVFASRLRPSWDEWPVERKVRCHNERLWKTLGMQARR
mgnify:CR=1 FL=1